LFFLGCFRGLVGGHFTGHVVQLEVHIAFVEI